MAETIADLIQKQTVLLDGGFGTELIRAGFTQGLCPESWNVEKPEVIKQIYSNYYNAGSDAVLTNSFGGSQIKLSSYSLGDKCYELNKKAAELAVEIRQEGQFIGGSVGPTGAFLQPQGNYTENDFEESFSVQINGLLDGGVDFILMETQYDLREMLCAVRAAKKEAKVPIFATMTFNNTPRGFFTMMGHTVDDVVNELGSQDLTGIGANCTLNSDEIAELIKIMRDKTPLPLIAQANAGQPVLSDTGEVTYSQGIDDYVKYVPAIIENGANIVGGCCGTDPDYIKRMREIIDSL